MAKTTLKPSDRGRNNPEPPPPPGTRAEQRGTLEQLENDPVRGDDPAVEWERSEQERLPPRGAGSQQNQGEAKGPSIADLPLHQTAEGRENAPAAAAVVPGLQSGGTRGPSNQGR
jgi:hypothetical protein